MQRCPLFHVPSCSSNTSSLHELTTHTSANYIIHTVSTPEVVGMHLARTSTAAPTKFTFLHTNQQQCE